MGAQPPAPALVLSTLTVYWSTPYHVPLPFTWAHYNQFKVKYRYITESHDAKRLEAFHVSANAKLWRSAGRTIYGTHKLRQSPATAQYWTSSRVAGTLSLDTSLGSPKTRQLTKHSGVTSTYLSGTFQIKAGGVVRAAQATNGSTRSAGTTTTYHQLICGGDPSCEVIWGSLPTTR